MSSYYTSQGVEYIGSGSGGGGSVSISSSTTTEGGDDINISETLEEMTTTINTLQSKLNSVSNKVKQYETIPTRLNALIDSVNVIQANAVNLVTYFDNTNALNNVYSTRYINNTLNARVPVVYSDIAMINISDSKDCYSCSAILNIPNITAIPVVYGDRDRTVVLDTNTSTYSSDIIREFFDKVPEKVSTFVSSSSGEAEYKVYSSEYINKLSIPSNILTDEVLSPSIKDVYNADYINDMKSTIRRLYNAKEDVKNGDFNGYTANYLDQWDFPRKIIEEIDNHISISPLIDTSEKHVYNTYYIDRFIQQSELMYNNKKYSNTCFTIRLIDTINKVKDGTSTYVELDDICYQLYGSETGLKLVHTISNNMRNVFGDYYKNFNISDMNFIQTIPNNFKVSLTSNSQRYFEFNKNNAEFVHSKFVYTSNPQMIDDKYKNGGMLYVDSDEFRVTTRIDDNKVCELISTPESMDFNVGNTYLNTYAKVKGTVEGQLLLESTDTLTIKSINKEINIDNNLNINGNTTANGNTTLKNNSKYLEFTGSKLVSVNDEQTFTTDKDMLINEDIPGTRLHIDEGMYEVYVTESPDNQSRLLLNKNEFILRNVNSLNECMINGNCNDGTIDITSTKNMTLTSSNDLIMEAANQTKFLSPRVVIHEGELDFSDELGANDWARLKIISDARDDMALEIATSDNGNEPIYVRQYKMTSAPGAPLITTAFEVINNELTLLDKSGNTTIPKQLNVKGNAVVTGATTLNNTLNVTGATTLNNTLNVTGATTLQNTLNTKGATTLQNTLNVTGATTLNSTLNTKGATTLQNTLSVTGATTLQNTATISGKLTVNNDIELTGWINQTSDKNLKENIKNIKDNIIDNVNVYEFNYKNDVTQHKHYGVIAQELQEICPELVNIRSDEFLGVNYIELIPHLIHKVQQQNKSIISLKFSNILLFIIVLGMLAFMIINH